MLSGKPTFDEAIGKVYRDVDLSMPQYSGLPSPEIDDAWAELTRGLSLLEYFGAYSTAR